MDAAYDGTHLQLVLVARELPVLKMRLVVKIKVKRGYNSFVLGRSTIILIAVF